MQFGMVTVFYNDCIDHNSSLYNSKLSCNCSLSAGSLHLSMLRADLRSVNKYNVHALRNAKLLY